MIKQARAEAGLGFGEMLARLREDPESLPWPQRVTLAQDVGDYLAAEDATETVIGLVHVLAGDRKGEVRKRIADRLLHLPEEDFIVLSAKLARDPNSLVRRSVARAQEKRRKAQWTASCRKKRLDHVAESVQAIERRYGPDAAAQSSRMAERLYQILIGGTVHDMKGMLTPLKSGIATLSAHQGHLEKLEPAIARKILKRLEVRVELLERMFCDMEDYIRPTSPLRQREQLLSIVKQAHAQVLDIFAQRGRDPASVSLCIDVPENIMLEVSRDQIALALTNVIENAYEAYSTSGGALREGKVEVTARVAGPTVEIEVRDEGMGFVPEDLEDFRRLVPGGTSKKQYGTGFGLPRAWKRIADHGGTLQIEGEKDRGATIKITLPLKGA